MLELERAELTSSKFFGEGWDTVNRNVCRYKQGLDEEIAGVPEGEDLDAMEVLKKKTAITQRVLVQWRAKGLCLKTVVVFEEQIALLVMPPVCDSPFPTVLQQQNKNTQKARSRNT